VKNYNQAIADYSSAIARNLKHAFVFTGRGNAKYVIKYYDHAIADFNSAIALDPNHAAAWAGRSDAD
jgi:tetratricopeptide (TPR) repeat protein